MHWSFRIAASLIWVIATGITLVLLYEFTQGAGAVYFAMMCFAVALASFSLVFARAGQKNGNWLTVAFSSCAWLVAIVALAVMELGYWDSKQEFTSSAHKTESLASTGRQELAQNAQISLESYKNARPSAEVAAERSKLLNRVVLKDGSTLAKATRYCVEPADFQRDCTKYADLGIELERSREKEKLEKVVWESATGKQLVVRTFDISAPAHIISRWTGVDDAITKDFLKGLFVFLLFIGRDGMLFVASAPNRTSPKSSVPVVKVARFEADVAQLAKPEPIPQISAPVAQEEPQEDPGEGANDKHSKPQEDIQEGAQEVVSEKPKKLTPKQIKKAAKDDPGKIVPFGKVSGATDKSAALESVVSVVCQQLEGEYPVDALWKRIAPRAQKRGLNPAKRHIGATLRNLGYQPKKRGTKTVYVLNGGSERTAVIA